MPHGPGYYRMSLPMRELAAHGHDVTLTQAATHHRAGGADIVIGQMVGHDNNPEQVNAWWKSLGEGAKLVYEMDDDVFEVDPKSPAYGAYGYAQDSLRYCLQAADMVTTSTVPLAEKVRTLFDGPIEVLPNFVDTAMLELEKPKHDKLVIGWAGSLTHRTDVQECAYGLRKTLERNPQVECHFIGADYRKLIGARRPIRYTMWREKTVDFYPLLDFDIGLAPVAPTVFNRSKSYVKILEYNVRGIPAVASAFLPYEEFVIDGVTGFLVKRPEQWAHRLRDLVNDEQMRIEMGVKAKQAAANYTIQEHWPRWEAAYKKLLGSV
jgi:glycosyltransferase involved in cell wall biosynthesis